MSERQNPEFQKFTQPESEAQREQAELPKKGSQYIVSGFRRKGREKAYAKTIKFAPKKAIIVQAKEGFIPQEDLAYKIRLTERLTGGNGKDFFGRWECEPDVPEDKPRVNILEVQLASFKHHRKYQK